MKPNDPRSNSAEFLRIFWAATAVLTVFDSHADEKIVAYVPNWIDLKTFSKTIDYPKITHLDIAFENPENEMGDLSFNEHDDALIAMAHANKVKVSVSIGGGSASGDRTLLRRYSELLGDARRTGFVGKISTYLSSHHFDGLDVDLEGPAVGTDYGAFIRDLAATLRPQSKLLTAALSQGYGGDQAPSSVFEQLDFVNIMAYDAAGPWAPKAAGQHSSMEFAIRSTHYWLERGLPKSKAVLGVPFYGYGFGKAFRKDDYPYASIVAAYPGAENADQAGSTIWYNGVTTIKAKAAYVAIEGLAGIMIWSLDGDTRGKSSLLSAIYETLRNPSTNPPH